MSQPQREAKVVSLSDRTAEPNTDSLQDLQTLVNTLNVPVIVVDDSLTGDAPFVVFVGKTAAQAMTLRAHAALSCFLSILLFSLS
jgi:hypothetical protein